MQENINILQEISGIAPSLARLRNHNPYAVPDGYFDFLSDEVITAIKLSALPSVNTLYSVPERYFDTLAENIIANIKAIEQSRSSLYNELEEVAPLLNSISRNNVYAIPDNYFENPIPVLPQSIDQQQTAKVISITSQFKKMLHYAVAASVMFVIATSSYLYLSQSIKSHKTLSLEQRLATLDENEIVNYLKYDHQNADLNPALQDTEYENLLINASDDEILNYLEEDYGNDEKTVNGI